MNSFSRIAISLALAATTAACAVSASDPDVDVADSDLTARSAHPLVVTSKTDWCGAVNWGIKTSDGRPLIKVANRIVDRTLIELGVEPWHAILGLGAAANTTIGFTCTAALGPLNMAAPGDRVDVYDANGLVETIELPELYPSGPERWTCLSAGNHTIVSEAQFEMNGRTQQEAIVKINRECRARCLRGCWGSSMYCAETR